MPHNQSHERHCCYQLCAQTLAYKLLMIQAAEAKNWPWNWATVATGNWMSCCFFPQAFWNRFCNYFFKCLCQDSNKGQCTCRQSLSPKPVPSLWGKQESLSSSAVLEPDPTLYYLNWIKQEVRFASQCGRFWTLDSFTFAFVLLVSPVYDYKGFHWYLNSMIKYYTNAECQSHVSHDCQQSLEWLLWESWLPY